jgi:hypothetical protein
MVSQQMPGRSPKQCERRYKRLRSVHGFPVVFTKTRSEDDDMRRRTISVIGIHFHFGGKSAYVGVESARLRYARHSNPFVNYIDQLTHSPIVFAAVSHDFYLLDYFTWSRSLKEQRRNPLTRTPMTLRDVTLVTYDNVLELWQKIRNLDDCRPTNPDLDLLPIILGELLSVQQGSAKK